MKAHQWEDVLGKSMGRGQIMAARGERRATRNRKCCCKDWDLSWRRMSRMLRISKSQEDKNNNEEHEKRGRHKFEGWENWRVLFCTGDRERERERERETKDA